MIPAGSRICESGWMRRGIEVRLGPGDRERLEAVIGSGNSPQKHVWRARIVLLSAEGVGATSDPPEQALVLSVDEKAQIQALDRTQPGLPMKKGRCGTMTHDYKRHGTTTLFAALDVLEGRVIGQCMARHRHQEFIHFLNKINRETAAERQLHLIVDNYAT